MATVISILCIDQKLKFQSLPDIASGGVNEDKVSFIFCEKWDNLTKTAVFYRTQDEIYHQLLDEDDTCIVPWEVLREPGFLYIGVFGVNEEKTRTSEITRCVIKQGAITEATAVPDPTPDIYAQILAKIGGGYYTPEVEQIDSTTIQISFVPSSDDLPPIEPTKITLPAGTGGSSTDLPAVSEADEGKVLTVKDGAWVASELPMYDGTYSVTPSATEDQTLLTAQKLMDADLIIEKIPYNEVLNNSGGTTVTIA